MERRTFLKTGAVGSALLVVGGGAPALLVTGCSTNWIQTIENDIPEIVNIITSIISVISVAEGNSTLPAAAGQVIQTAVAVAQQSLSALQDAVNAYKANESQGNLNAVIAALNAAQADVQKVVGALPAGSVAPAVITVIVAGIGTAVTILSAIQVLIPGAAPAPVTAAATKAAKKEKIVVPNAAAIRTGFDAVLRLHGFAAQAAK